MSHAVAIMHENLFWMLKINPNFCLSVNCSKPGLWEYHITKPGFEVKTAIQQWTFLNKNNINQYGGLEQPFEGKIKRCLKPCSFWLLLGFNCLTILTNVLYWKLVFFVHLWNQDFLILLLLLISLKLVCVDLFEP